MEHDFEWMRMVLQGAIDQEKAKAALTISLSEGAIDLLLNHVLTKPLKLRSRALAVLASAKGMTPGPIAQFLCVSRVTVRNYISEFRAGGAASVLDLSRKEVKKVDDPKYINAVFKVLHTPPAVFGFNQTSWRMDDLHATLAREGCAVEDFELRVLHPVQQHVHAGEVVGGDVLLLAEDLADGAARVLHPVANVEQQGARSLLPRGT